MSKLTYDEWVERFIPVNDAPLEWAEVCSVGREHIWTLVEDGDDRVIVSGAHYVNRLGYFATEVSHNNEFIEVPDE